MKTFEKFKAGKYYRRDNDRELFCCRGNYLHAYPKIYGAYAVEELRPDCFTQVEIEEKIVKVRNKRNEKGAYVNRNGEIFVEDMFIYQDSEQKDNCKFSTVEYFSRLVSGDFKDDFEFITEVKILEEIPHVSKVDKPIIGEVYYCKEKNRFFHVKAEKEGLYECSGFTEYYNDAQTNIQRQRLSREYVLNCLPVRAIDKFPYAEVSEITKSYKVKDTNKDLKLAIIGIETDEQRRAVQEKAFSLGCKWPLGQGLLKDVAFTAMNIGQCKARQLTGDTDSQNTTAEQIEWIMKYFPEATIVSAAEFLNNY